MSILTHLPIDTNHYMRRKLTIVHQKDFFALIISSPASTSQRLKTLMRCEVVLHPPMSWSNSSEVGPPAGLLGSLLPGGAHLPGRLAGPGRALTHSCSRPSGVPVPRRQRYPPGWPGRYAALLPALRAGGPVHDSLSLSGPVKRL